MLRTSKRACSLRLCTSRIKIDFGRTFFVLEPGISLMITFAESVKRFAALWLSEAGITKTIETHKETPAIKCR
jgi:hypothetical protein